MFHEYSDIVSVEDLTEMLSIGKNAAYKLLSYSQLKRSGITVFRRFPSRVLLNIS